MSTGGERTLVMGATLLTLVSLAAEGAWAQFRPPFGSRELRDRRDAPAGMPQLPPFAGTVEAVAPGWLQITTGNGEAWRLQVLPTAKVKLFGTATQEFLASGQFISFTGLVDKEHGQVVEPVSKLTIFTPDQTHLLGAFPAGGDSVAPAGEAPAAEPQAEAAKPAAKEKETPAVAVEPFQVAGRIASARNGKLTVVAPNTYFRGSLKVALADEPQISLDLAGAALYSLAKKGDRVEVSRGGKLAPQVAQVSEMVITLAQPLEVKKPQRRGKEDKETGRQGDKETEKSQ